MSQPTTPASQTHQHGPNCGHTAIRHDGHVDYLNDGHLEHPEGKGVSQHVIPVSNVNPDRCAQTSAGHGQGHVHGPGCGHQAVPHGNHTDYLVNGHLHHVHGNHCDDHGSVETA